MPYYVIVRESVAIQSCGVRADNPEEALKEAAESSTRWETDDIEPCRIPGLWAVEDEDGNHVSGVQGL